MSDLPFGAIGQDRTPAEWAQLHAGIEFLTVNERFALLKSAQGYSVTTIAFELRMDEIEVRRIMERACRTLATWERNACRWSTRFVAVEPMSEAGESWRPGDSKVPERP